MKKSLLLFAAMLLIFADSYSQASFNTGAMEVYVNQYGRLRLYAADGIQQLERASILVGVSSTEVFDYTNDAEEKDPTDLVAGPTMSDFEIYGSYDNAYSGLPPAVTVKQNTYGWNNAAYTVIKYNVTNDDAGAMSALLGLDIIPFLNEEYGFDSVSYVSEDGVIRFHRGNGVNLGIKLLSSQLTSLYSFEWFDGYSTDGDLWTWMNYGSLQPLYASNTVDGPVSITSQAAVDIASSGSADMFYAFALGADESEMLANIAAAEEKYIAWFSSVDENQLGTKGLLLEKNFPNPFNNSTTINYQLADAGFVTLKVYNSIGMEVATLVDSKQSVGQHSVNFSAFDLPNGVYFYSLNCNGQVKTNKMQLVK
jgi:hypothetical protein